ncbi:DUF975 family protein [Anaerostipes faecalis]|uniref:DUF975 family protein n=1 Tax=Anaerostipes faecalis TaxID=2738446 RepID=UPI001C1E5D68|nr:DUF975 family protein [Anaerostipes faecalis]
MWTREELKRKGKEALHRNYWITVLAALIFQFFIGRGDSVTSTFRQTVTEISAESGSLADKASNVINSLFSINFLEFFKDSWIVLGILLIFIWAIIFFLLKIFIGNLFEIGARGFFIENSRNKASLGLILDGFRNGHYTNKVLTLFLRDLYTFLWALLFIVPGIVKSYEYSMVSYILAENPGISRERAFKISKEMMRGQKWDAFVLDLSYIGWMILGTITLGIVNVLYTNPYRQTTWVELYKANRQRVLDEGTVSYEELSGNDHEI